LSPFLFALYTDQLSIHLQAVNVGFRLGNLIVNHFLFADDIVIFAPSAKGLQELLDVCSNFADTHRVVFNVSKSQCLIVHSKGGTVSQPVFRLCSFALQFLGRLLQVDLKTGQHMKRAAQTERRP